MRAWIILRGRNCTCVLATIDLWFCDNAECFVRMCLICIVLVRVRGKCKGYTRSLQAPYSTCNRAHAYARVISWQGSHRPTSLMMIRSPLWGAGGFGGFYNPPFGSILEVQYHTIEPVCKLTREISESHEVP